MIKTKIATKGQTTIPKEIRLRLGLRPGDELEFVEVDGEIVLRKRVRDSLFKEYRGYLKGHACKDPDELVEESRGRWLPRWTRTLSWISLYRMRCVVTLRKER